MKPVGVKLSTYIDFNKENNKEDPKFKVGGHIRISKFKNIFVKGYIPNWSEKFFVIEKVKITIPWTFVISDLMVKKLLQRFTEKICKKQIKQSLELKK